MMLSIAGIYLCAAAAVEKEFGYVDTGGETGRYLVFDCHIQYKCLFAASTGSDVEQLYVECGCIAVDRVVPLA